MLLDMQWCALNWTTLARIMAVTHIGKFSLRSDESIVNLVGTIWLYNRGPRWRGILTAVITRVRSAS